MIITIGYFLLVGLTTLALNPFLAFGLAIIDLIITATMVQLIAAYWSKEAMGDMFDGDDDFFGDN